MSNTSETKTSSNRPTRREKKTPDMKSVIREQFQYEQVTLHSAN